jgi:hypothetical protein
MYKYVSIKEQSASPVKISETAFFWLIQEKIEVFGRQFMSQTQCLLHSGGEYEDD